MVVLGIGTRFFTERELVMYGAFLSAASQIGNAFAPNVAVLMATQGFIFGKYEYSVTFAPSPPYYRDTPYMYIFTYHRIRPSIGKLFENIIGALKNGL